MTFKRLAPIMLIALLTGCDDEPNLKQTGANPDLPAPQQTLFPTTGIAKPVDWNGTTPKVPNGYKITAIATDFETPRQLLVLPNGDILVVEGKKTAPEPLWRPKGFIQSLLLGAAHSDAGSGNRVTLLRDTNGDGLPDMRTKFIEGLNAPYGIALIGAELYIANTDSLVRFHYKTGDTQLSGSGELVTALPAGEINHHWTKALAASADGRKLYVGIGSNSNITERGLDAEYERAQVWEVDAATGAHRTFATGIRNPSGLAVNPNGGTLFAVANERDELGPNLVPDYLTEVKTGAFYGWPYSYWGQNVDDRVRPQNPDMVASAIKPDYALGSHVAPLGLAFSNASFGAAYSEGVFIGEHGSWNRNHFHGYKVVFVPFSNGHPSGEPQDIVTGFIDEEKGEARGRPVGVALDATGALLVADDLSNTVWRVAPAK